jgi:hypothetical protein
MGLLSGFDTGFVGHTLFTNLRWEDDEFNFIRQRESAGATAAIEKRDALWGGLRLRSDAIAKGEIED